MAAWAVKIAKKFPGCAFINGRAFPEELQRVVGRLGLEIPEKSMTDKTCIHCKDPNRTRHAIGRGEAHNIYAAESLARKWTDKGSAKEPITKEELDELVNALKGEPS